MFARFASAWLAALGCAALAAVLEARWAYGAATQALNAVRTWLVAFGLVVPVALAVAVFVAALSPLFVAARSSAGTGPGVGARGQRLSGLPVLGLATAVLVALVGHLALAILALDLPPLPVAASLALGTWVLARILLGAALTLCQAPWLRTALARLPPGVLVALAVALLLGPLAWGVHTGTTNGEGGFWGIFGVLGRQELDLRAVALVTALALAACAGVARPSQRGAPVLLASAFAAFAVFATAFRLLDDQPLSLALERGAALSRASLRGLRAATDGDGDGVSAHFGANDCDDTRDDVYPGAPEAPGNGIDEDCSGTDAARLALMPQPPPPPRALASAGPAKQAARIPPDLNVLLITVDTLRHDLGYVGYPRPISRNLDQLAAKSVVFERAYALASYTGKSIGPLLIGKYPSETQRGFLHFNRFGTDETFVQERLQAAGVRTLSVQGHWYFTPEYGVGRGFDVLDLSASPAKRQLDGDKTVNSDKLSDAAIAQLSRPENTNGRFFMWVHYLDPHAEYIRHKGFDFGNRGRDLYDSEVAFSDQQIGRVLDFVASSELGSRTAIIVTSDHGEAFGEHGMWRHGFELWEALVRVPLIVHVPGVAARRHDVRRGAIDLVPTLLSLFGVPLPSADQRLSGQPLVDDIFMPPGYVPSQRPIFIDMSAGPYNEERQALIDDDIKLIMSGGRAIGLYDLGRDPAELADQSADGALLERERERFVRFQSQLRLVRVKPP